MGVNQLKSVQGIYLDVILLLAAEKKALSTLSHNLSAFLMFMDALDELDNNVNCCQSHSLTPAW